MLEGAESDCRFRVAAQWIIITGRAIYDNMVAVGEGRNSQSDIK